MIPAIFVLLDAFPLTANGKVDYSRLPAPEQGKQERDTTFVAPRSPIEDMLASLWTQLLHQPEISIYDDFFVSGGHSLLATRLIARIRQLFRVEIPLRCLFETPTIAGLAHAIIQAMQQGARFQVPPLQPTTHTAPIPLSFAQQRFWFIEQYELKHSLYNVGMAFHLLGKIHIPAFLRAFYTCICRHDILRTRFVMGDASPLQIIAPLPTILDLCFQCIDLQCIAEQEQENQVIQIMRAEQLRTFNLSSGPLLRGYLFLTKPDESYLLLSTHHIVTDEWSLEILCRELSLLYAAFSTGAPSPLPPLPVQYADYSLWQQQYLQGERLEAQLTYWKKQLAGVPPLLELPLDHPRPPIQTFHGATVKFSLSPDMTRSLKKLGQRQEATLFMVLCATFQLLLSRYSGQNDISLGVPIANRPSAETEELIGCFINIIVLRVDLTSISTFCDLLAKVRQVALEAYAHQDVPFEQVVEVIQPEREMSYAPLFQVMFNLQNAAAEMLHLDGLQVLPLSLESEVALFDLALRMEEGAHELTGDLVYNVDLFEEYTIVSLAHHFQTLLERVVASPDAPLQTLSLLSPTELTHFIAQQHSSSTHVQNDLCIHQMFEKQVTLTPDAIALHAEDQQLSYRALNQRANQLAYHLLERNMQPETRIGLYMERSLELVVGVLGVLKAGGAYLPLDPTYTEERRAFMLDDAHVPLLLTQTHLLAMLPPYQGDILCLDALGGTLLHNAESNPCVPLTTENLAYTIYTSGSTGRPKGSDIPHRSISGFMADVNYVTWDAQQTLLLHSSISWDALTLELYPALLHGARCVLYASPLPAPQEFKNVIEMYGVSVLWLTSSLFNMIIDTFPDALSALPQLLIGGEALSLSHVNRALALLPTTRIVNGYGPSECTVFACCYPVPGPMPPDKRSIPIGRPIGDRTIWILDEWLNPVPSGVPGELYISGPSLARGYLNQPALTAEKFVPHPFSKEGGERLYRTGDRARYLSDQSIEFLGRFDQQVKIRGFRIEPGEIEALLNKHPALQESVVLVQESSPDNKKLVAYAIPRPGAVLTPIDLRNYLKGLIPEYMIPAAFLLLEAWPLTPNGKLDRQALPSPGTAQMQPEHTAVLPHTPAQQALADIWSRILENEQISIYDNFFEIGGHSLLAIQLVSQIREYFSIDMPLLYLFEAPTIAQLATKLEEMLLEKLESLSEDECQHLL